MISDRDIRFKPQKYHWRGAGLLFELAFFHAGFYFNFPVQINEITAGGVQRVRFNPDDFDYGANKLPPQAVKDAGFGGFRVHYPLNTPKYKDETVVFLGASYFRAIGKGQRYGSSSRGLAIDTGLSSGEEFPRFVEFWIERPTPKAQQLVIYALLDSKSVTGAYRFVLQPGIETGLDVRMQLHPRDNIAKAGIAPLTGMFLAGENQRQQWPTTVPRFMTPTACRSIWRTVNGYGGRLSMRGACWSHRLPCRIRWGLA